MAGGRPTKYNRNILKKAKEYLENYAECGDAVPSAAGLACELGVSKASIYKWGDEHQEFSYTLQAIQAMQERKLASGGLTGAFQPTIAKLMLANHGYHEKQDIDHGGKLDVSIEFIDGKDSSD
mgnify:CR=1 FL=1